MRVHARARAEETGKGREDAEEKLVPPLSFSLFRCCCLEDGAGGPPTELPIVCPPLPGEEAGNVLSVMDISEAEESVEHSSRPVTYDPLIDARRRERWLPPTLRSCRARESESLVAIGTSHPDACAVDYTLCSRERRRCDGSFD